MFLGTYEPRLDEKGRLILPAKYRDELASGLVLTRGQDRCVYVFPMREFEQLHDLLRTAPVTDGTSRNHLRMFLSAATDEVPDKQGRVTIPAALRQWASLERDVAVIGAGSRVEIWDVRAWHDYVAAQEDSYSAVAEEVIPGIF